MHHPGSSTRLPKLPHRSSSTSTFGEMLNSLLFLTWPKCSAPTGQASDLLLDGYFLSYPVPGMQEKGEWEA